MSENLLKKKVQETPRAKTAEKKETIEEYKERRTKELNPKSTRGQGSKVGCKEGYKRQTLILEEDLIKKIKQAALNENLSISDLVGKVMKDHLKEPINQLYKNR